VVSEAFKEVFCFLVFLVIGYCTIKVDCEERSKTKQRCGIKFQTKGTGERLDWRKTDKYTTRSGGRENQGKGKERVN